MLESAYRLSDTETLETPALVYYEDIIRANTVKAIEMAGDAARLWPHVKTHKMAQMVRMQLEMGITRFKCATIAEAQMLADCGAPHILLAYPLVGPNIRRFISLMAYYPASSFYAIGDDAIQLEKLSAAAKAADERVQTLLDIGMGMNRTGVPLDSAEALYRHAAGLSGLEMMGMHCYDGHIHDSDFDARARHAQPAARRVYALRQALTQGGIPCQLIVIGGTPSFPVHAREADVYLSPGTVFVSDWGYRQQFPDLPFVPGAAIATRVISHPGEGLFTLDVGSKAIATDPKGQRGVIAGLAEAEPVLQSEEHWVFRMPQSRERPAIGAVCYVIPTHVCPTTALHAFAWVAKDGRRTGRWFVTARNRRLDF